MNTLSQMNLFLDIELYHICVQFGYTENEQVYGASVLHVLCYESLNQILKSYFKYNQKKIENSEVQIIKF